jgi:lipid II:glycine glycyltransferase (peptidoglycan interpeptide bridge formation enzyme)
MNVTPDIRQTKEYGQFLKNIGWTVKTVNGIQIFIKKVGFLGSAIKVQRTDTFSLKKIEELASQVRAFQIIIEPTTSLGAKKISGQRYRVTDSPFLPTKTVRLNIKPSGDEILSKMKKDARYSIKKSSSIKIKECTSINEFRSAWSSTVGTKRHVLSIRDLEAFKTAFGKNCIFLLNEEATSGGFFLKADTCVYYWAGFTNKSARKSLVQYQIIWKAILWGKKSGAIIFDFEGIYDERFPKKDWIGFTHFKKSFGGEEVSFPGCFVKWRFPF